MESVTVRVPATSANVVPGFDTMGIALSLYNYLTFTRAEKTEVLGCPAAYANEDNLALVAFRAACRAAGVEPCPVRLEISADIPDSRGLGSSAAMLVGGAVGANLLLSLGLSKKTLLEIVNGIEGHPDNVAPALLGGFVASLVEEGKPLTVSCGLHPSLRFCAFIPDFATETREARAALPKTLTYADAVFNISHVAVLLHAMANGDTKTLGIALRDRLHEDYRRPLIHEFDAVRAAALKAGAHAFYISGSGSTCMAIYTDASFPVVVEEEIRALRHGWRVLPLLPDAEGACAVARP